MRFSLAITGLLAVSGAVALPEPVSNIEARQSGNPFSGRTLFVNPKYSQSLQQTRQAFQSRGDTTNADKVAFIQNNVGTFVWISNIFLLRDIDDAIRDARAAQQQGQRPVVGLVLYNLPDRDCSAGHSSGELSLDQNGLNRYRQEYVAPFAQKVKAASDLQFAIVLEPDAIGNMVTGTSTFCRNARRPQQDGIAYAIQQLQASNVALYLDVANGGWLGWESNLEPTAAEVATILEKAGGNNRIRGYSSNVSNYNPYQDSNPPAYTDGSPSPDEFRYANSLANALGPRGLPTQFIIDQGRVARPGARSEWGEWCNVHPAGFGQVPTTDTNNANVDALVWVKPGGESDGTCGMSGAPQAGSWFDAYAQMLTENAHPGIGTDGSSPPSTTTVPSPPTATGCADMWSQCGGQGWNGATCCSQGTCQVLNEWYSQCS